MLLLAHAHTDISVGEVHDAAQSNRMDVQQL
jgi:hypothetical protein